MNGALALKLLDGAFLLIEAGLNRQAIIDKVQIEVNAGASAEEIADMLRDGRIASEAKLQDALNEPPPKP